MAPLLDIDIRPGYGLGQFELGTYSPVLLGKELTLI